MMELVLKYKRFLCIVFCSC